MLAEVEVEVNKKRGRKPMRGAQIGVKLPDWAIEAIDAQISARRYSCRAEAVRRIVVEALLKGEREGIKP